MSVQPAPLAEAYDECETLARSHYENFPVASRLLPAAMRPHVAAIYAFARVADDIADEGEASPQERCRRLREWQQRLHSAAAAPPAAAPTDDREERMLRAAAHSIRSLDLPLSLFDDLVSAFGQDIMTTRYDSWADVLDYCRRSANPIGRLMLRVAGYHSERLDRSSDALCTALQLANFWQDLGRDWSIGRLYVPAEVSRACGADEAALGGPRLTAPWVRAIERCAAFTRERFAEGRAVCDGVGGRLKIELRFTWLGGMRILERVERARDLLPGQRPALGPGDVPLILWRALSWSQIGETMASGR